MRKNAIGLLLVALCLSGLGLASDDAPRPVLNGLDPVLLVRGTEERGSEEHSLTRGRFIYLFSSARTKAVFQEDPDKFGVQFGGACVVSPDAEGKPHLFRIYQERIYLFASEGCIEHFEADPESYLP